MKRAVVVVAVGLAVLAGCSKNSSVSAPSATPTLNGLETRVPKQVLTSAKNALAASQAVHVSGSYVVGGQPSQIDMQLQGKDAQGSQTARGQKIDLIETGGVFYVKGPAAFWRGNAAGPVAAQLADKWVKIPETSARALNQINTQALADSISASDSTLRPDTTRTEVDGRPAVVITQQDGSQLFVANTGDTVPLRLVNKGAASGTLNFTDYGRTQTITAPAGAIPLPARGGVSSSGGTTTS